MVTGDLCVGVASGDLGAGVSYGGVEASDGGLGWGSGYRYGFWWDSGLSLGCVGGIG